jgi:DNA ligase (NAD+)
MSDTGAFDRIGQKYKNNQIFDISMKATEFLTKLKKLSKEDLLSIKGIGDVLAQNFDEFLSSKRYEQLVEQFGILEQSGVALDISPTVKRDTTNLSLAHETICITGSFDISRENLKQQLEALGAKVVDSISSNTTILLAGEKAGSKLEKAKKLNIKIVQNLKEIL